MNFGRATAPPVSQPLTAVQVLREEFKAVHGRHAAFDSEAAARTAFVDADTAALCLSGGGIRSASFCLGVAQGLARTGLLTRFHFLSTVSGGGYAGSMLAAWAYRTAGGFRDVERALRGDGPNEAPALRRLREKLSYLAPRRGLATLDTWTLMATYVRNFLLNAALWLPMLALLLLVPHLAVALLDFGSALGRDTGSFESLIAVALWLGALMAFIASVLLHASAGGKAELPAQYVERLGAAIKEWLGSVADAWHEATSGALPQAMLAVAGMAIAAAAWWLASTPSPSLGDWLLAQPMAEATLTALEFVPGGLATKAALGYAVMCALAGFVYRPIVPLKGYLSASALSAFVGGLLTALLCIVIIDLLMAEAPSAHLLKLVAVLGAPAMMAAAGAGEILFVGATSNWSSDFDRERWALAGARVMRMVVAWTAWSSLALFAPALVRRLQDTPADALAYWTAAGGATAVLARVALLASRRSPEQGRDTPATRFGDRAIDAVALLLLLALGAGMAEAVSRLLGALGEATQRASMQGPRDLLPYAVSDVLLTMLALALVLALAGRFININRFSLHAMYRDRLIRAFLGASRDHHAAPDDHGLDWVWHEEKQFETRHADRYIQLDHNDNPMLRWMSPARRPGVVDYRKRPLLLVNAALNLVAGRDPALQERKASSWTMSALHVGSAAAGLGYRRSNQYAAQVGGITLGTAMAVSGAAVSPNAGTYSSPVRTFLLALFNARLGWWIGHPADLAAVQKPGPRFALKPMLREMFGLTDDRPPWVFVSDGGHFDNLGLYEAIRRGCRTVVVIDASCDPSRNFDDLGNAIRKIRIDLGVTIRPVGPWRLGSRSLGKDGRYCALFDIDYPESQRRGRLVYIKPCVYERAERLPVDVVQYAARSVAFPHESTVDQFFSESQFESYRALGAFEIEEIAGREPLDGLKDFEAAADLHVGLALADLLSDDGASAMINRALVADGPPRESTGGDL